MSTLWTCGRRSVVTKLAMSASAPEAPVEVERLDVELHIAGHGPVRLPAGEREVEHHLEVALARCDHRRVPVDQMADTGPVADHVAAVRLAVGDDPSVPALADALGSRVVGGQPLRDVLCTRGEQRAGGLGEGARCPRPARLCERLLERFP
jgi:hypothetical protein